MSDLIKIQLAPVLIIIPLFAIFLRKGMLQRAFHLIGLDLNENNFAPLKIILIGAICWLTWILLRDIWIVLR
jgi:hypothetical protein